MGHFLSLEKLVEHTFCFCKSVYIYVHVKSIITIDTSLCQRGSIFFLFCSFKSQPFCHGSFKISTHLNRNIIKKFIYYQSSRKLECSDILDKSLKKRHKIKHLSDQIWLCFFNLLFSKDKHYDGSLHPG